MRYSDHFPPNNLELQGFTLGTSPEPVEVHPSRCVFSGVFGERKVEPKVMGVMMALAKQPGEVVSRQELLDLVWPDVVVEDQVLSRSVSKLRNTLDDAPGLSQIIQTVPKKGYRLIAPVTLQGESEAIELPASNAAVRLADADSIVVFPLAVFGGASEQSFLGTGISRDLTQLLSLVPNLRVVPCESAERASREASDLNAAASELGARYIVDGSLELRGSNLRLRIEMSDTQTNQQLCSRRSDANLSELFSVQDDIVQELSRTLSTALGVHKVKQLRGRDAFNLQAYEYIQLAEDARRNYNRDAAAAIVDHLHSALRIQPGNGVAHALLAMQLSQNLVSRWSDDPAQTAKDAAEHLKSALTLDPADSRVLMAAGIAAQMRGDHEEAFHFLERSLEANPNEPHTLAELATARLFLTKELEPSIHMIEIAEKSSPDHPRYGIWAYRRGICHYECSNFDRAIAAYNQAIARLPTYHHVFFTKAVALARSGNRDAALDAIKTGLSFAPNMPYAEYETGVLAYGLSIPLELRDVLSELWAKAL